MLYRWDCISWDRRFIFGSSVHKHRSKTLLTLCAFLQTLILSFYLWCWSEVCILLCTSVILCQSLLRTVDCQSITPAFWKLLLILQTCLLGFIFTAFRICLSSTTVVFSADQVVVGVAGGFQTLDFSMPFVFAIALIYFLFSVSIQIACFSKKVSLQRQFHALWIPWYQWRLLVFQRGEAHFRATS